MKQLANDVGLLRRQLFEKDRLGEPLRHRHKWPVAFSQQLLEFLPLQESVDT